MSVINILSYSDSERACALNPLYILIAIIKKATASASKMKINLLLYFLTKYLFRTNKMPGMIINNKFNSEIHTLKKRNTCAKTSEPQSFKFLSVLLSAERI